MRRGICRGLFTVVALAAALLAPLFFFGPSASADEPTWEARLQQKAGAIVSVKFVLKTHISFQGQSQDEESNREVRGVVVDASGLVLLANSSLEGDASGGMLKRLMGGMDMSASPSDVKVLFGSEAKEYPAVIVARDSTLGLAYVQIVDLEGKTVEVADLSKGAEPQAGALLYGVTRRARGFDCAPVIDRLFVTGRVEKPRPMWGVTGNFSGLGLPVYALDGAPVGVLSMQQGVDSGGDEHGGGIMAMMGSAADAAGTFVLPLDVIGKSLVAAKKRVPEALEKAAKAKEAAAKEGEAEKPKEPPPPGDEKPSDAPKAPEGPK